MSQQAFALQAPPPRSGIGKDAHPPEHQGRKRPAPTGGDVFGFHAQPDTSRGRAFEAVRIRPRIEGRKRSGYRPDPRSPGRVSIRGLSWKTVRRRALHCLLYSGIDVAQAA